MAFSDAYRRQATLLVRVLPFIAGENDLAMKGGTAINLFIRDLPRLSVDIDLTYLRVRSRSESLADIGAAMSRVGDRIRAGLPGARVTPSPSPDGIVTKLLVRADREQINDARNPPGLT